MTTTMTRSDALEHLHTHIGIHECEWEEGEPEPIKFSDMSLDELLTSFCSSGVFSQVFDGTNVYEEDLVIVEG
jgi:hypothetical protein